MIAKVRCMPNLARRGCRRVSSLISKVQAISREQESATRLVIRNPLKNLVYVTNGIRVEWIREIDNLIVWIVRVRLHIRLISDYKSIVTQTSRRGLAVQTLNRAQRRNLYLVQV